MKTTDHETDPNFTLSYIATLQFLSLLKITLEGINPEGEEEDDSKKLVLNGIADRFDEAIPFIIEEMSRYPGFDWQTVLIQNRNFTVEACLAIKRNQPELLEQFKEKYVPALN